MLAILFLCLVGTSSGFIPRRFVRLTTEGSTTTGATTEPSIIEIKSTAPKYPSVGTLLLGRIAELDQTLDDCLRESDFNETDLAIPTFARHALFYCARDHPELRILVAILNLPNMPVSDICLPPEDDQEIPPQLENDAELFSNGTIGNIRSVGVCDVLNATARIGCAFPREMQCSDIMSSEEISERFYAQFYVFQQLLRNESGKFDCPGLPQLNPLIYSSKFNRSSQFLAEPLNCPAIDEDVFADFTTVEPTTTEGVRLLSEDDEEGSDARFRRQIDNQIHRMAIIGNRARRSIARI